MLFRSSLVFPGKGFLNTSGIYSNITVEFWTRINNESPSQVKIFGPLTSEDGIYVGGEFITVKVGKYVKSYFIGQWYRPMLAHFGQSVNEIFLMINGEKVISIAIDSLSEIDSFTADGEDYLAFYGDNLIFPFDIDSFSIFPFIFVTHIAPSPNPLTRIRSLIRSAHSPFWSRTGLPSVSYWSFA